MTHINEGIHDPSIFKAVFTIGGPGSGKSTVSSKLLGASGLRPVDIDRFYQMILDKNEISGGYADEVYKQAAIKNEKRRNLLMQGRLGLVIDGTGRRVGRILVIKNQLESIGYDTMALFVNTDLRTALERNELRTRKVDPELVKKMHQEVTDNLGELQRMFGNRMMIVDNSGEEPDYNYYGKEMDKFLRAKPSNPAAKSWIKAQTTKEVDK